MTTSERNDEQRRLLRLAQLCYSERLIDATDLVRIEQLDNRVSDEETTQIAEAIFSKECLKDLENKLESYQADLSKVKRTFAVTSGVLDFVPGPTEIEYVEDSVNERADVLRELKVNHWSRLLFPLSIIALIGLVGWVIYSFEDAAEKFWWEGGKPPGAGATTTQPPENQSFSSVTPPGAVDGSVPSVLDTSVGEFDPSAVAVLDVDGTLESVDANAEFGNWDRALAELSRQDAMQDPRLSIARAGLLLGKASELPDSDQKTAVTNEAMSLLLLPDVLNVEEARWNYLFAVCLIGADRSARELAAQKLAAVSPDPDNEVQLRQEWALARNSAPLSSLPELDRRVQDQMLQGVDNFFCVCARIANGQPITLESHLKDVDASLKKLEGELNARSSSVWIEQLYIARVTDAVARLRRELAERTSAVQ